MIYVQTSYNFRYIIVICMYVLIHNIRGIGLQKINSLSPALYILKLSRYNILLLSYLDKITNYFFENRIEQISQHV